MSLLLDLDIDRNFWPKNHQPPTGEKPVCPYYQMLENAAAFAGVSAKELASERKFCGNSGKGDMFGPKSTEYAHPRTTCTQIRDRLSGLLLIAQDDTPAPDRKSLQRQLRDTEDTDLQGKLLDDFREQEGTIKSRETVIEGFKGVVYASHVVHEGDLPEDLPSENDHFRTFSSPDQLSDEEVISKAKQALNGLITITGPDPLDRFSDGEKVTLGDIENKDTATSCEQAPQTITPTRWVD